MRELSHKDSKAAVLKMLQQAFRNTLKISEKARNLSKEIEDIKKKQMEILEPK